MAERRQPHHPTGQRTAVAGAALCVRCGIELPGKRHLRACRDCAAYVARAETRAAR